MIFEEPTLLGSAGTVRANRQWVSDGRPFLVAYADNLTSADLTRLARSHAKGGGLLTMALFRAAEPSRCGIVELRGGEEHGEVVSFEEKPAQPKSNLANAGLYMTDHRIIDEIPDGAPVDFGFHVLPRLVGRMCGHVLQEPLMDVGTMDSYQKAQHEVVRMGLLPGTKQ